MPDGPESIEIRRLRSMMCIRRFEERAFVEYTRPGWPIGGFLHLSSGQEAIAVGAAEVLRRGTDFLIANVRHHGHTLALGTPPKVVMAELFGHATGCCRGKGGSMHLFDAAAGNLGGILRAGGQHPLGIGAAFSCAYRNNGGVCLVLCGEGSLNTGAFAESMNLASLWKLPAVFVVEDNGVAIRTRFERASADPDPLSRGKGYAMPRRRIDGNDVEAVIATLREAADRARGGEGPTFVVAETYRFRGHSMTDGMKYRTNVEMNAAREWDPITLYEVVLRGRGIIDDAAIARLEEQVNREIDDAIREARNEPHPGLACRFEHILSDDALAARARRELS